jgi:hypothetical protein
MRYHSIVWLFSAVCMAVWTTPESGDIFLGRIWVEPEINTLSTFSDTSHYSLEVQCSGMVLFAQYDIPKANPKSTCKPAAVLQESQSTILHISF